MPSYGPGARRRSQQAVPTATGRDPGRGPVLAHEPPFSMTASLTLPSVRNCPVHTGTHITMAGG